VENVAYEKESWINSRVTKMKRHVRQQWLHSHASRAVDGQDDGLTSCTVLDNFYVDQPVWMVDLGVTTKISGVVIVTWAGRSDNSNLILVYWSRPGLHKPAYASCQKVLF